MLVWSRCGLAYVSQRAKATTSQLGDLDRRMLRSDRRAGAIDIEAGVLVVVHQPPSKVDGFLLGQVACGHFGFESSMQSAPRLNRVGNSRRWPHRVTAEPEQLAARDRVQEAADEVRGTVRVDRPCPPE